MSSGVGRGPVGHSVAVGGDGLGDCKQVGHAAIARDLDQLRGFAASDVEIDLKGGVGVRDG